MICQDIALNTPWVSQLPCCVECAPYTVNISYKIIYWKSEDYDIYPAVGNFQNEPHSNGKITLFPDIFTRIY